MVNVNKIRQDFPILQRETAAAARVVYLDSTATAQKPFAVIEAMNDYYRRSNANIHRGVHTLAEEATAMYEGAREKIAKFINAPSARQIIYTRNTTESINLVAYSWARANLQAGDLVVLTEMEHHSNLVPWHMLQTERGIDLDFIPVAVLGIEDQLRRVIYNLVDNAIKYTQPGGLITITLQPSRVANFLRMTVTDTGYGIAPAQIPHVFDRFYRVEATRPRYGRSQGSGLGLPIAKSIVESLGGKIGVSSDVGKGSSFWVELPLPDKK